MFNFLNEFVDRKLTLWGFVISLAQFTFKLKY